MLVMATTQCSTLGFGPQLLYSVGCVLNTDDVVFTRTVLFLRYESLRASFQLETRASVVIFQTSLSSVIYLFHIHY